MPEPTTTSPFSSLKHSRSRILAQTRKGAKVFVVSFAPFRLYAKNLRDGRVYYGMLVCGQRAVSVVTARGQWCTIIAEVKLSLLR